MNNYGHEMDRSKHPREEWPLLETDLRAILLGPMKDNGMPTNLPRRPPPQAPAR